MYSTEAMQFYNVMLLNFQKQVVVSVKPQEIAYRKSLQLLENNRGFGGYTMEELIKHICEYDEQLTEYFQYSEGKLFTSNIADNYKVRKLCERLLNTTNVGAVKEKPLVLQWFLSDVSDVSDPTFEDKNKKISKVLDDSSITLENKNNISEKTTSYTSYTSDTDQGGPPKVPHLLVHNSVIDPLQLYKCNYCSDGFPNIEGHMEHFKTNHQGLPPRPHKREIEEMKVAGEEGVDFKGNAWE